MLSENIYSGLLKNIMTKLLKSKKKKYEIEQYLKRNPHDLKKNTQKDLEILEKYINNSETKKRKLY